MLGLEKSTYRKSLALALNLISCLVFYVVDQDLFPDPLALVDHDVIDFPVFYHSADCPCGNGQEERSLSDRE